MKSIIVATIALATAFAAVADGGPRGCHQKGEGLKDPFTRMISCPKMAEKLQLSEEQKAKIREIREERTPEGRECFERMRTAVENEANLMRAPSVDEGALMAAIDEVFESRKAVAKMQAKRMLAVRGVLNEAQVKVIVDEIAANRPKKPCDGDKCDNRPPCDGDKCDRRPPCDGDKCDKKPCDGKGHKHHGKHHGKHRDRNDRDDD